MTARRLCRADELSAQLVEIGGLGKDSGNAFLAYLPCQSIGAEHEQIARLKSQLRYVRRDGGLRADGAGNDIA